MKQIEDNKTIDMFSHSGKLRVVVVFEFENISDPDSPEADAVVQAITEDCETMQVAFDANGCWVDDVVEVPNE
jgi:hypothetical protein